MVLVAMQMLTFNVLGVVVVQTQPPGLGLMGLLQQVETAAQELPTLFLALL